MRLAWFTPWPPDRSGVAGRSAELVPRLASRGHAIDVFVACPPSGAAPPDEARTRPGAARVLSAHAFVWRHAREAYDLILYQAGNSRLHEFLWPYLFEWPGLVVLHDLRLQHARGAALLGAGRPGAYRAEFAHDVGAARRDAAEMAVAGFDGPYCFEWPMLRAVIDRARAVGVHTAGAVEILRAAFPGRAIEPIALGEGLEHGSAPDGRAAVRRALGWTADHVVVGVFGALTAERRVPEILRAFHRTVFRHPHARLLLAGARDRRLDLDRLVASEGLSAETTIVDAPGDQEFDALMAAADLTVNLRWPSALETSGPWVRALALGLPTIVFDLPHLGYVPMLDPRTWRPTSPASRPAELPVAIAVDVLDEEHSLWLALGRLVGDAAAREAFRGPARAFWEAHHTLARMADDYERVMARAAGTPDPADPLPWRDDPHDHGRALVRTMTVPWPLALATERTR
jgi:glycosyltransferase involved in cell wall biosynthesis